MSTSRETGRQRAMRIPLDYYKRPGPLERGKKVLAWTAIVAGLLFGAFTLFAGDRGNKMVSRGQVHAVHAAWDQNCEACHVPFSPITKQNFLSSFLTPTPKTDPNAPKVASDQRCQSCHLGTDHHASQMAASTPSCGGCHRDHRGLDASLVRLPDGDCTQCHGNLGAHTVGGESGKNYKNDVTSFAAVDNHPEFRIFDKKKNANLGDPGVIKFNHKLHMTPGQVVVAGQASPWTLKKIRETDKNALARYRDAAWQTDKGDDALVQLDCRSCHQVDARDPGAAPDAPRHVPSAVTPSRSAGAYMQPIVYDTHCKACHPLTFDDEKGYAVPHRYQPEEIRKFVEGAYAKDLLGLKDDKAAREFLDQVVSPRPLPGKSFDPAQSLRSGLDSKVETAMRTLLSSKKRCGECHYAEGKVGDAFDKALNDPGARIQVGPTEETKQAGWFKNSSSIPEVWYLHAKFNHASHRAVDCKACHDKAMTSEKRGDILVPGIDNCRQCHVPTRRDAMGRLVGGVRHDCTECHRYHNGDEPLSGVGARKQDPRKEIAIDKFLQGARD